jgi:sec-independent protein translocase protein TatA
MFGLGVQEVLIVCLIGLLLFGKKLPELARAFGKTFAAFKAEVQGTEEDLNKVPR